MLMSADRGIGECILVLVLIVGLDLLGRSVESRLKGDTPTPSSPRVSSRPDEVREKQDDHESAPGLELLEEAGQNEAKNKTLQPGYKGGFEEVRYAMVRG